MTCSLNQQAFYSLYHHYSMLYSQDGYSSGLLNDLVTLSGLRQLDEIMSL